MTRNQGIVLAGAALLFVVLYFVLSKTPKEATNNTIAQSVNADVQMLSTSLETAKQDLSTAEIKTIDSLEKSTKSGLLSDNKVESLKQLSSFWYKKGNAFIAAYYANQVAELDATEEAWSIAGTSYTLALDDASLGKFQKDYVAEKAREAFDKAIAINPDNVQHFVNKALCNVKNPPAENPMQGILDLKGITEQFPEEPAGFYQLGRFSLQTGQMENAVKRFEQARSLGGKSPELLQGLIVAYEALGNEEKVKEIRQALKESK